MQALDGRNRENLEKAFIAIACERIEALIVRGAGTLQAQRQQIVEATARQGIPALYARFEFAQAGGLLS